MNKKIITVDPYRRKKTTLLAFAQAEGVPKYTVSQYYRYHKGSLEGFRDRPPKGTGNGIVPHTYSHKGKICTIPEAIQKVIGGQPTLVRWHKQGYTDLDEINRMERQRRQNALEARKHTTEDGRRMTIAEIAKEAGVTSNTVSCYLRNHKGSLKGFSKRGHSRINPRKYLHSEMGVSKTAKEWAAFYGVKVDNIKVYLNKHNRQMDGYVPCPRLGRPEIVVEMNGKKATLRQWAQHIGASLRQVVGYYYNHGHSLEGFGKSKRGRPKKS